MIKGVLLDLSGTVHIGPDLIPGAAQAVARLREAGIPLRFVTNTSRMSRRMLMEALGRMGLEVTSDDLFTAPAAAAAFLRRENLRPHLLVHPNLREDFADLPQQEPNAVLVTYAEDAFTYVNLNVAFRLLRRGARLLTTSKTPYFQGEDGLMLDAGPFVVALEYASGVEATVLGKPAKDFFLDAVASLGCLPEETVLVGDDAASDVGGALKAGLRGILVRTGKYRPGDEEKMGEGGIALADAGAAAEWILERNQGRPETSSKKE